MSREDMPGFRYGCEGKKFRQCLEEGNEEWEVGFPRGQNLFV